MLRWPVSIGSRILVMAVLVYAFLAGFHTMDDPDMWWQLAHGRYLLTTGHIARTEVFSYTAPGAPWIYPVGNGLIFQLLYQAGGFRLLSLLSAAASAFIAAVCIRRGGLLRYWMAAFAIPLVALTTTVRANLFTMVMAALFLEILWRAEADPPEANPSAAEKQLWLLPPLMLLWVNLHPGFIYGLAMVGGFAAWRVLLLRKNARRHPGEVRLPIRRQLLLVTAGAIVATLVNPWGWRVYEAILAQQEAMPVHRGFIAEWGRMPLSWAVVRESLHWRDPRAAFWWLLALTIVAIPVALFQRRFLGGLLGASAVVVMAAAALTYARFQGLYAIAAVIIVPDLWPKGITLPRKATVMLGTLLICFVSWRASDLITNEYYFSGPSSAVFGAGVAAWPPERAARFVEEHRLPREIYHSYATGGYLLWRMTPAPSRRSPPPDTPAYPVFIDGRALPYGESLFLSQQRLGASGPESPDWQAAFDHWKIRTVITATDRFVGYGTMPLLSACDSPLMRLVYLDETAVVFVLTSALTPEMNAPALDCKTAPIAPPRDAGGSGGELRRDGAGGSGGELRLDGAGKAARYRYWTNVARLFLVLHRLAEAEHAIAEASAIFDGDPALHFDRARLLNAQDRPADAEREFRKVVEMAPYSAYWEALADHLAAQERYNEARQCYWQAVAHAYRPYEAWAGLAPTALLAGRPKEALQAAGRALEDSPFHGEAEALGRSFTARMQGVRGDALLALLQLPQAVEALQQGLRAAPPGTSLQETLYLRLADAYYQSGRRADARTALDRANGLAAMLGENGNSGSNENDGKDSSGNAERRQRLEWLLSLKQ